MAYQLACSKCKVRFVLDYPARLDKKPLCPQCGGPLHRTTHLSQDPVVKVRSVKTQEK